MLMENWAESHRQGSSPSSKWGPKKQDLESAGVVIWETIWRYTKEGGPSLPPIHNQRKVQLPPLSTQTGHNY